MELTEIGNAFHSRYPIRVLTVESHTQGEPTRLLVDGVGPIPGETMKDKCDYFKEYHDSIRLLLTREPRGHRGILAAVVTEPVNPESAFGLFYMDARRYPFLCGHATIGAVATLVRIGVLDLSDGVHNLVVDTPSGPLEARTEVKGGAAAAVSIRMVPSFVYAEDRPLAVPGLGEISVDLVCVGGFFVMIDAARAGLDLESEPSGRIISLGMAAIDAANAAFSVRHPERPEVSTVDVTEFYTERPGKAAAGKSAVIYGESHMDRSPCGTGTTAKMTLLHHRGELALDQTYTNTGYLGTTFSGRLVQTAKVGPIDAVVGEITGNAQITGICEFVVDPDDPFPEGFLI
ncbi:MAG: proline racemase family protein [Desulfobacterales bacterium]|jgi:proline racemase